MIVAVTGLAREARLIMRPQLAVAIGGGDCNALRARIEQALSAGARRIISMGVCGALSPTLKVGDSIVATEVVAGGEMISAHRPWATELLSRVPEARPAVLAGADAILADASAKARMYRSTGAEAVDMESHVAASVAHERGLPFAAFRVVSDSSDRTLPPAALVGMSRNGRMDVCAVIRSLISNPAQIPALIRTAWEAERAFRVLFRSRHVLDPAPAFADLGELSLDMT